MLSHSEASDSDRLTGQKRLFRENEHVHTHKKPFKNNKLITKPPPSKNIYAS
ncbi:hypothetical protein CKO_00423 [Citrobacter koseri ATCC BAA-895]|uniref:Uncharacterized protein n=1 Tax=Citrobacter koseri (strain ATCC BAA-895 / CDC 4225-83 / SGSC4696) TaxID=290338 RepID=A8ADL7_CITK8|nr:hypothetical protein CKO_00423 [Citrobacter koseri ATCC BAA-895]